MRACMPECFQQVDLGEARVTNPTWCPTQLPRDSILEPSHLLLPPRACLAGIGKWKQSWDSAQSPPVWTVGSVSEHANYHSLAF